MINNIFNYKKILKGKILFKILLILFLFERYMVLAEVLNLKNLDVLIDKNQKKLTKEHIKIIRNLFIKLTEKIE